MSGGGCAGCDIPIPKMSEFKKWKWVKHDEDTDVLVCPKCYKKKIREAAGAEP